MTPSGKSLLWEMRRGRLSKMAKTVYVPRFGSQLHGSQTNEPKEYLIDLPPTCTQKKQYENCLSSKKGQFTRSRNYVKNKQTNNENKSEASPIGLLQYSCRSVSQTRRALDCEKEESKSTSQGTVFDPEWEEELPLSEPSQLHKTDTLNEKLKPAVLRTIAKMLRENRYIRRRLLSLSQASRPLTRVPAGRSHRRDNSLTR
ncbi:uncharacterized protein LOC115552439 [Gadus morhua]|uniref:uncharacterized protein LOC115552439 n=1 Tax=Gadus morhua TaxID=8049 RepID=UPI0011B797B5|nr:uncharacterized protein LOC115552439 [Gadus morhua]